MLDYIVGAVQADGAVKIAEPLRPYMGGQEVLVPVKEKKNSL